MLNLSGQELEEPWTETTNIIREECKDNARGIKDRKIKMHDRRNTKNCQRQVRGKSKKVILAGLEHSFSMTIM